ncbi:MAG: hypothetical protein Q8P02_02005, partial [Candidatus Micrarchaeota archaeon]|nr:hypothetical protein [Candidatus Micrarchaeota archaeon]
TALSSAVFLGLHAYLVAFGVLSGALVALMGPSPSRAPALCAALAVLSVGCFLFSAGVLV